MKSAHRTTHQIKSLTFLLSLAESATIENLHGKRVRLRVPVNNREFDGEPGSDAWFYAIADFQLGNATTPAPAGLTLRNPGCQRLQGDDASSPRKAIVSEFVFDLEVSTDAAAFEAIPIIIKGFPAATDAPAVFSLPPFTSTEEPVLIVTDKDGGAVGLSYEITSLAAGGEGSGGEGTGDVIGPASSIDNAIPRFNGTGGKTLQNSTVIITDAGAVGIPDIAEPGAPTGLMYSVAGALKWAGKRLAQIASTLGASQVVETDSSGNLISVAKGTAYNKNFGTGAGTVTEGNDARLSNARTPTAHSHDDRYYTEAEADALLSAKADLVGGVIPTSQIPAVAIGETFPVASQSAMLALTAQQGDVAIRSDEANKKYLLLGANASVLSNWSAMGASGGAVQSVNAQTGDVVLGYADVGAAPASTATSLTSHTSDTNNPHSVTKTQVGLGNVDNTADSAKSFTASQINNSTATGRSVLTASDAAAARAAIGAGTGSGDVTLAGTQTLTNKTLTSAVLDGTPVVPTQAVGNNSTAPASTAFVQNELNDRFSGARGERLTNLSCNDGADVPVPFTSEQFDDGNYHDNTTNNTRFTVTTAGIYSMVGSVEWTLNTAGRRQILIKRNGTQEIGVVSQQAQTTAATQQNISCIYQLSAGDYVEMVLSQNSGTALQAVGSSKFNFTIVRLS